MRFFLPLDAQLANPYFGQIVIVTKEHRGPRARSAARLKKLAREEFAGIDVLRRPARARAAGRPAGAVPVSGPDIQKVRELAQKLADADRRAIPCVGDIGFDWNEPGTRGEGRRATRTRPASSASPPRTSPAPLNSIVGGTTHHPGARRDLPGRRGGRARARPSGGPSRRCQNLQLPAENGQSVPLAAVATFQYELEQPVVWRRNRLPTITVQGRHRRATCSRRRSSSSSNPAVAGVRRRRCRPAMRSRSAARSRRARKCAGADRRGGAADAVHHGDDPDDPAAELPAAVPGGGGGAARADRRGGGAAAQRHSRWASSPSWACWRWSAS